MRDIRRVDTLTGRKTKELADVVNDRFYEATYARDLHETVYEARQANDAKRYRHPRRETRNTKEARTR